MRELTRSFVEAAYDVIGEGALSGEPLYVTDGKIKNLVDQVPLLNVRDRAHVKERLLDVSRRARAIHDPRRMAEWLTSRSTFGEIYSASYSAEVAAGIRVVEGTVVKGLSANRGRSIPTVFYLISSHQNPAKDHAELQGTVLIDRFWRSALGGDASLIAMVDSYIASNSTLTVQEAMQGPHWLLTRPNCHHWLEPMQTEEVLRLGSDAEVKAAHPESQTGARRDFPDDHARYVRRERMLSKVRTSVMAKLPRSVPRIHI
jgi:hypothetical protein